MESSDYYFVFCFLDVGSDKAKYYFIPPPHNQNVLQYPRIVKPNFSSTECPLPFDPDHGSFIA